MRFSSGSLANHRHLKKLSHAISFFPFHKDRTQESSGCRPQGSVGSILVLSNFQGSRTRHFISEAPSFLAWKVRHSRRCPASPLGLIWSDRLRYRSASWPLSMHPTVGPGGPSPPPGRARLGHCSRSGLADFWSRINIGNQVNLEQIFSIYFFSMSSKC